MSGIEAMFTILGHRYVLSTRNSDGDRVFYVDDSDEDGVVLVTEDLFSAKLWSFLEEVTPREGFIVSEVQYTLEGGPPRTTMIDNPQILRNPHD